MTRVKKAVLAERERQSWDLTLKGWTQEEIATHLQIERSTVSKTLKRLTTRALTALEGEVQAEKIRQVEQLRRVVKEALAAWEKSKTGKKVASRRSGSGAPVSEEEVITRKGGAAGTIVIQSVTESAGESRYLETAMKAMSEIRKILGLDAPQKFEGLNNAAPPTVIYLPDNGRGDVTTPQ